MDEDAEARAAWKKVADEVAPLALVDLQRHQLGFAEMREADAVAGRVAAVADAAELLQLRTLAAAVAAALEARFEAFLAANAPASAAGTAGPASRRGSDATFDPAAPPGYKTRFCAEFLRVRSCAKGKFGSHSVMALRPYTAFTQSRKWFRPVKIVARVGEHTVPPLCPSCMMMEPSRFVHLSMLGVNAVPLL